MKTSQAKLFFCIFGFFILTWSFTSLGGFWYTLAFAFFIGLAMEPIVNRLERRGVKRGIGTGVVLGGLILGTTLFFAVFGFVWYPMKRLMRANRKTESPIEAVEESAPVQ